MKKYLQIEQIVHREKGWDNQTLSDFIDAYIELVESFEAGSGGGFDPMTEKEVDDYFDGIE